MRLTIGLAQSGYPQNGDVVAQVQQFADEAAARGAELLVFPEGLMCPGRRTAAELRAVAQPLGGPFVQAMSALARERGLWMVVPLYEADPAGGAPYNTAVVIDDHGALRASYRKCHLYDAHGECESDRTQPGAGLFGGLEVPWGRLGLGICYDLRFPEVARQAALAGCELLLFPAAWIDGAHKLDHWRTLLRARATENELFVAGVCRAGERCVGHSLVADPLGQVRAEASGKDECLVCCTVELDEVAAAREAMPVFGHRRPELYGK